jgi:hypothetical protein
VDETMGINKDKLKVTKNRTVMRKAMTHMDEHRKKTKGVDTVAIIREWRDKRT